MASITKSNVQQKVDAQLKADKAKMGTADLKGHNEPAQGELSYVSDLLDKAADATTSAETKRNNATLWTAHLIYEYVVADFEPITAANVVAAIKSGTHRVEIEIEGEEEPAEPTFVDYLARKMSKRFVQSQNTLMEKAPATLAADAPQAAKERFARIMAEREKSDSAVKAIRQMMRRALEIVGGLIVSKAMDVTVTEDGKGLTYAVTTKIKDKKSGKETTERERIAYMTPKALQRTTLERIKKDKKGRSGQGKATTVTTEQGVAIIARTLLVALSAEGYKPTDDDKLSLQDLLIRITPLFTPTQVAAAREAAEASKKKSA